MKADTELIILPYDSASGKSLLHRLITEIQSGDWKRFRAAVAFAKTSGNFKELIAALVAFAKADGTVELTFGADVFGADTKGSDLDAIKVLLDALGDLPRVRLFLYHEKRRTFHPKVYLFDDEAADQALLVVGSSNWSEGGLANNVEVDVVIHLKLSDAEHRECYERVVECFKDYWSVS